MSNSKQKEKSKGEKFTSKIPTGIWLEEPTDSNPYISKNAYLYGYEFSQLVRSKSYPEMLYLMLSGELPNSLQVKLLEFLLKAFITPGLRHPATRAAMNAGIGRTEISHILPIGLQVLSGNYLGSKEVAQCMLFLKENVSNHPRAVAEQVNLEKNKPNPIPGFGTIYNGIDSLTQQFAEQINADYDLSILKWSEELIQEINRQNDTYLSWLPTGLAAIIMAELGLTHRVGCSLFQLLQSPGIFMHGVEKANKPLTDMPFIPEENYVIKNSGY